MATKYYIDIPVGEYKFQQNILLPNTQNEEYNVEFAFHLTTQKWYINIQYLKDGVINFETGWNLLVVSQAVNFNFQQVMPYAFGLDSLFGVPLSTCDDLADATLFKCFIMTWDDYYELTDTDNYA